MSFRMRLIVTILLLIAITFSVGGTILIEISFGTYLRAEIDSALDAFKATLNTLYLLSYTNSQMDVKELGQALSQLTKENVRSWQAVALWAGDVLIYQRGNELLHKSDSTPEQENQCAYRKVNDENGTSLIVESSFKVGTQQVFLLGRFDLSAVYEARENQQKLYVTIYVLLLLVGIATAVILSYVLTGRLRKLTTAVRKISDGDMTTRSRLASGDEFGQLSQDFDSMADKLQDNIAQLQDSIQRQESFMGSFAHELKTPMTSIIGFSDLLRQGNLDENTRMMAAEYIYSEGHRLERLSFKLQDLLLLKKDDVEMKQVWLPSFVEEIHKTVAPNLKKKGIRFICRPEQKRVLFEPDLVKSLLYNLIDNASKAIEQDGIIVVTAETIPGGCRLRVSDNGRGMEKEELGKITDAFYRVDKARSRAQGGAGLGLALCKQIVELHEGQIHFESVPGKGTNVEVTLYGKAGAEDA